MSDSEENQIPGNPVPARWIQVHQQKSSFFRVVHADGVWASVSAHNNIHLTFFSERFPLPTSVFFGVDEKGSVIGEDTKKRETKKDWVREMEVDVVLTVSAAKGVVESLERFIKIAESI